METYNSPPFYYNYENRVMSDYTPSTVHCKNTSLYRYFCRQLLQKTISVFDWNIPKEWNKDYFLYVLYCYGFVCILDTKDYGVIPQICGFRGYDVYYAPAYCIVVNPHFKNINYELRIDKECALVKMQPDYGGVMDTIGYYADLMAIASEAVGMNLVNSKLSYVFAGTNKTQAQSFKKLYDNIASGEPAVFVDKDLFNEDGKPNWQLFDQNVGNNYVGTDILNDLQSIEGKFMTEIGIPNNNFEKKERLVKDEVNSNNVETASRCELWLETIRKGLDTANNLFGLNLSVDWRYNPIEDEKVGDDVESNDESNRSI